MNFEAGVLIALCGLFITMIVQIFSMGFFMGRITTKLESVEKAAVDLKTSTKEIWSETDESRERIVAVEASASSAHKRLDDHIEYDHKIQREKRNYT